MAHDQGIGHRVGTLRVAKPHKSSWHCHVVVFVLYFIFGCILTPWISTRTIKVNEALFTPSNAI